MKEILTTGKQVIFMIQSTKTKIAILSMSAVLMSPAAISVILAKVRDMFPDASLSSVQLVMTVATLASLAAVILAGKLVYYMSKKNMMLVSLFLMSFGGAIGLLFHQSIASLYTAGVVLGLGQGMILTTSSALIADYFENGERNAMMGQQSAVLNLIGALIMLAAGWLSALNWYYVYFVYLLGVPVFLIVKWFLPKGSKLVVRQGEKIKISNSTVIYYCAVIFIFSIAQYTYATNVALLLENTGLGTSAMSGVATACIAAASFLSGMFMGHIIRIFRRYTFTFGISCIVIGLLLSAWAPSLVVVLAGGAFVGIAIGSSIPSGLLAVAAAVPAAGATAAIAAFSAASAFGMFCSPLVINNITLLFGSSGEQSRYLCAAVLAAILLVLTIVRETIKPPRRDNTPQ